MLCRVILLRWRLAAFFGVVVLCSCAAKAAIVFAPPENSPDATAELKSIEREMGAGNYPAAARRLDVLFGARGEQLADLTDNALTSVIAWLDQVSPAQRKALAAEYAKSSGVAAREALESFLKGRIPSPEELYAFARRYPMTAAAGSALVQAGDRSLQLGDFAAAQALYELAVQHGAALVSGRAKKLEALQKIAAGETPPAPPDLFDTSDDKAAKRKPSERRAMSGPLPFDAPWFGHASMLGHAKFFPWTYDDHMLISSWKGVWMLGENGQPIWSSPSAAAPGGYAMERAASQGRGALFAPAVLTDVFGEPALIVVRQPTPRSESQFILRALRASDGRTLWTTPGDPKLEFTYAGLPAVSGRYVYCVAVQKTLISGGNLLLCALDINNGQPLWQATLGSVSEQGDIRQGGKFARGQPLDLASFADLSEPAVSGDLVIVSPNCGSLIAVGRFDGKIRWVYTYRKADGANGEKAVRWMGRGEGAKALQTRYRSTPVVCGDLVLTLPQDTPAIVQVDRNSGKVMWETDLYGGSALAGTSGNMAILCGESLSGVDTVKKRLVWKYDPPRGTTLTGPAVVMGHTVIAPTTSGFIQLNTSDGKEKPVYDVPNLRRMLTADAGKATVTEMGISKAFGVPDRR